MREGGTELNAGGRRIAGYVTAGAALAAVIALGAVAWALSAGSDDGASSRPNVVVIMTDDQESDSIRFMPSVNRLLARRGTTFRRSFATFPRCCPSRATFLTGQYAHNHGVLGNRPPDGGYAAFRNERGTLPMALRRSGYHTAHIGRYLNGYGRKRNAQREVPPGWDEWRGFPKTSMYRYRVNQNGRMVRYGTRPRDYQTDVIARGAVRFIRDASSQPFLLSLAPIAPHSEVGRGKRRPNPRPAPRHSGRFRKVPLSQPPSFDERDVSDKPRLVRSVDRLGARETRALRAKYRDRLGSLLAVDDMVRRVVDALRASGELHNTYVIFTSDNGFLLGEHRRRLKGALYEESVRVPLIVRGPGVPEGETASQLVGNIDLAPTIFDLTGARSRRRLDGRSLMPVANDAELGRRRALLLQNQRSTAIRTRRFLYVEHPKGERELYDMRRDPFQLESRHEGPRLAGKRAALARRLHQLRGCAGSECR